MATMTDTEKSTWLTTGQVAELLGISPSTVPRLIRRGELPARRVGGWTRVRSADALAYLKSADVRATESDG